MSGVFLDTVGILGFWDEDDQWHLQARTAWMEMRRRRERMFTTNHIIAECANATSRWIERSRVAALVGSLETSGGLIFPTDADWREAWAVYAGGRPGEPGLVDELSFTVMRRLGLRQAFTNDRHFSGAGFEALF